MSRFDDDTFARLTVMDAEMRSRALGRLDEYVESAAQDLADEMTDDAFLLIEQAGSPIEALLGVYLLCISDGYHSRPIFHDAWGAHEQPDWSLVLGSQVPIGRYTADFLFKIRLNDAYRLVAVECDGHDFHERTKAQARHDKGRDRFFLANGVKCLRFTGSEIYGDPQKCADEVQRQLEQEAHDLLVAAGMERARSRGPIA